MKTLYFMSWAVLITLGAFKYWHSLGEPGVPPRPAPAVPLCAAGDGAYTAVRSLPPNHRVLAGEFSRVIEAASDPAGKYLSCEAKQGASFGSDSLRQVPDLTTPGGYVPVLAPLAAQPWLLGLLDAGGKADVWRDGRRLLIAARVLATVCNDKNACFLAIEAPEQRMSEILKDDSSKLVVQPRVLR